MFCPRCGQQCTNDARFCSRCGLLLNGIAEVMANNGLAAGEPSQVVTGAKRNKGVRIGTILMLASVAASPIFFALSVAADGPAPLLAPLTIFLTGLCYVLYGRAFGQDSPPVQHQAYPILRPKSAPVLSLPDRQAISGYGPRKVNTADMAEPPSVTDHTTQFFD